MRFHARRFRQRAHEGERSVIAGPVRRLRRSTQDRYLRPVGTAGQLWRAAVLFAATWPKAAAQVLRAHGRVILVHQPGKVGSLSIYAALRGDDVARTHAIFHTHLLNPETRRRRLGERLAGRWAPRRTWAESAFLSLVLRLRVVRATVITVVRDPFDAHPSAFLQNPEQFIDGYIPGTSVVDDFPVEQLVRDFRERFPHEERLQWYHREIRGVFGVDLFADAPEASGRGWSIFRQGKVTVCLLRYEALSQAFPAAMVATFGHSVTLPWLNQTSSKGHQTVLEILRDRASFGDELIEKIEGSELRRWSVSTATGFPT